MYDSARLKWFVKVKTETGIVNYELDEERSEQMVWRVKNEVEYCVCLQMYLTILDENDHLVFFLCLLD